MSAGFFRGTSQEQDARFADKQKKLMQSMQFPSEYDSRVDMRKVKLDVLKPWITKRMVEILAYEDEVVIGLILNTLEAKQVQQYVSTDSILMHKIAIACASAGDGRRVASHLVLPSLVYTILLSTVAIQRELNQSTRISLMFCYVCCCCPCPLSAVLPHSFACAIGSGPA